MLLCFGRTRRSPGTEFALVHPMMEEALDLMRALFQGIVTDETLADEIACIAEVVESSGHYGEAEALCVVSRNHRIRALEARAHIGLLEARFGSLND